MINKIKVLTIDDEQYIREIISTYLTKKGFLVLEAENGINGLDIFHKENPDVILVDLRMPELDGLDVMAAIKISSPDIPIIVVSGTGVMADAVEALRRGAWDFIVKPIEDMGLIDHSIAKALERSRLLKENKLYREHLEDQVMLRTKQLEQTNIELKKEIEEHKLTEQMLKTSESKYRQLYDNIQEGFLITDMKGNIIQTNTAFQRMLEYSPEELYNINDENLTPEKWHEFETKIINEQVVTRGYSDLYEKEYKSKTGIFPVELRKYLIKDDEGNPDSIKALIQNISERKQMQDELRNIMAQQYIILENVGVGITFVKDRKFIWTNTTLNNMLGYTKERLQGQNTLMIYAFEDDYEYIGKQGYDTISEGITYRVERLIKRSNGSLIWCNMIGSAVHPQEPKQGSIWMFEDITDRKKAEMALKENENLYRTLVETIPHGIEEININGIVTFANRAYSEIFGYDHSRVVGMSLFDADMPERHEIIKNSMVTHTAPTPYIANCTTADKRSIYVQVDWGYKRDKQGKLMGLISVITDITDKKRAEEFLKKANDELELRVKERTLELEKINLELSTEINERKKADDALTKSESELRIKTVNLEEANTALRVLLKKRDEDKLELEEKVVMNVKELVVPYMEKLKKTAVNSTQKAYINIIETHMNDIISPFIKRFSAQLKLTPTEIQIATLIKEGKNTKEIAEICNISSRTIEFHRDNIRKKIGLNKKKINLRSYLLSIN